jgi:hypothetical protein
MAMPLAVRRYAVSLVADLGGGSEQVRHPDGEGRKCFVVDVAPERIALVSEDRVPKDTELVPLSLARRVVHIIPRTVESVGAWFERGEGARDGALKPFAGIGRHPPPGVLKSSSRSRPRALRTS